MFIATEAQMIWFDMSHEIGVGDASYIPATEQNVFSKPFILGDP